MTEYPGILPGYCGPLHPQGPFKSAPTRLADCPPPSRGVLPFLSAVPELESQREL